MSNLSVKVAICPEVGDAADAVLARWGRRSDEAGASKRRSLVARSLLRGVLESLTGIGGREWSFTRGANGKPFAVHPSGIPAPEISISHSGSVVTAAATRQGRLGIDVELHRSGRRFGEIAEYAFGPEEAGEAATSEQDFYRIWTLREAMAKATGAGLTQVTDGKDTVHGAPAFGAWEIGDASHRWRLAHVEAAPGYSLAIALNGATSKSPLHWSLGSIEWLVPDTRGAIRRVSRLATVTTGNDPAKLF